VYRQVVHHNVLQVLHVDPITAGHASQLLDLLHKVEGLCERCGTKRTSALSVLSSCVLDSMIWSFDLMTSCRRSNSISLDVTLAFTSASRLACA
jgi:hypothetical protein